MGYTEQGQEFDSGTPFELKTKRGRPEVSKVALGIPRQLGPSCYGWYWSRYIPWYDGWENLNNDIEFLKGYESLEMKCNIPCTTDNTNFSTPVYRCNGRSKRTSKGNTCEKFVPRIFLLISVVTLDFFRFCKRN